MLIDQQQARVVLVDQRPDDAGELRHLGVGQAGSRFVHQHE
jgi:hypothetical protein